MPQEKPISIFQLLENVIRSHEGEEGIIGSGGYYYKAKSDWEAPRLHSENWGMLTGQELAANQLLWHIYGKIDPTSRAQPLEGSEDDYTMLRLKQYPSAQLHEQLRRVKSLVQKSFRVNGNNVEFTSYFPEPESLRLLMLVQKLIGNQTPSGLPIVMGNNPCVISMKYAEQLAPLLELNMGKTPPPPG